jgi:hypothetical protein
MIDGQDDQIGNRVSKLKRRHKVLITLHSTPESNSAQERKRGWLPIPAFSHREPPFCVAAIYYLFFAPFLAPPFFAAAFFFAPPFFAVAIVCFSFR